MHVPPQRRYRQLPTGDPLKGLLHVLARTLSEANLTPAQVDAITEAVRQAADHGDHVTSEQFKAGLAELRTEIAGLRTDLTWRMLAGGGPVIAALRFF